MVTITAIDEEVRSGGVRLQVDGSPFATVAVADVAALGLRLGAVLDDRQAAQVASRADQFAARCVAVRLLSNRALPRRELEQRLLRRGHGKDVAQSVVAELAASGMVNDIEFAEHYARTRARRRRLGPARLSRELQRMGIAQREADAAVRQALDADGVDTRELLREAAERKWRALAGKEPAAARRTLRAYLLRRGFPGADISAIIKELARPA